jgi:hypothetical protein
MSGKICATEADFLNAGMSKGVVWVDSMVSPICYLTLKWFCDLILFWHGALINRKNPVHTEYNIDVSLCSRSGGVRKSSKFLLLLKYVTPTHHYLFAWHPPMLFALVASRVCTFWVNSNSDWCGSLQPCIHDTNNNCPKKVWRVSDLFIQFAPF